MSRLISALAPISPQKILDTLHRVHLRGDPETLPYQSAKISYQTLDVQTARNQLRPAQRYAITGVLDKQRQIRSAIADFVAPPPRSEAGQGGAQADAFFAKWATHGVGAWLFRMQDEAEESAEYILMPPIVEVETDANGNEVWLVADGLHRTLSAMQADSAFAAIVVRGASLPYYADPEDIGWDAIPLVEARPVALEDRKNYREPASPKRLFRDYNTAFGLAIQPKRK